MSDPVAFAALGWSIAVASVSGRAIFGAARAGFLSSSVASALSAPAHRKVALLRPCRGHEANLASNLASFVRARRSFEAIVLVLVPTQHDEAVPSARAAIDELVAAGVDARLVVTTPHGPNHKVVQLALGLRGAGDCDTVVVADSDVDLTDASLDDLVAPIALGRADAVWAPPMEMERGPTLGDLASSAVLGASLHAFPLLASLDPRGMVGKLFVVDRAALARAGGFEDLRDVLGEDVELARRLAPRVETSRVLAVSRASGRSFASVVERFARWMGVVRAQRPALLASYPFLFFATPLILALATARAGDSPGPAWAAIAIAIVARVAIAVAGAAATRSKPDALGALLADVLLFAAFLKAISTRSVTWRGRAIRFDRTGRLAAGAEAIHDA